MSRSFIYWAVFFISTVLNASIEAAPMKNGVTFIPKGSKKIVKIEVDRNKTIYRYPSFNRVMEVNRMVVNGRSPIKSDEFIFNSVVHFIIYVIKGTGTFIVDGKRYQASVGDVIDVPPKTKFAVTGSQFEYITIENPAWFPEQNYIVDKMGKGIRK